MLVSDCRQLCPVSNGGFVIPTNRSRKKAEIQKRMSEKTETRVDRYFTLGYKVLKKQKNEYMMKSGLTIIYVCRSPEITNFAPCKQALNFYGSV